ncbi:unnamed protein product [Darwinula stevensoni]|uniref:Ribosomal RNA small subunit methyltransferase NEP1 n=1 Tax=Darwinula stevensoni TaxID=69355 RepID=A0A7R9A7P1_9CRUS|nr:unnamed protein product [Darwinula stevensoni]CAG0892818.1 unnamed protein product [Darwinula stevensoni]
MPRKRRHEDDGEKDLPPRHLTNPHQTNQQKRLIVVLENAHLDVIKVGVCSQGACIKRFAGLMVQLLHKLSIKSTENSIKLLKVIKNPVTDYLPAGCKKIGTSYQAKELVRPRDLITPGMKEPVVYVVGAMAHGKVNVDYTEKEVAISEYPLSAALTCTKLLNAFEDAWGIT